LAFVNVKKAAYICPSHADAPEVAVYYASNAEVQAGPGGSVVACPVGSVAASTWEGRPAKWVERKTIKIDFILQTLKPAGAGFQLVHIRTEPQCMRCAVSRAQQQ
jgi:hypothetical protein